MRLAAVESVTEHTMTRRIAILHGQTVREGAGGSGEHCRPLNGMED